jgi:hypothetical protein
MRIWAYSTRGFAVFLLLLLTPLASCGSDKSSSEESKSRGQAPSTSSTGPTGASGTTGAQKEPTGSLSPQEYRLVRSAYSKIKRADKAKGLKKSLEQFRSGCEVLRDGPTSLIETTYKDCVSSVEFFDEIIAFPKKFGQCGGPTQEISTESCLSAPIQAIAAKSRTAVETSKATNRALHERKIGGRCYRAIGTSERDLRNVSRIATTADGFDKAIQSGNAKRVTRATDDFRAALDRFSKSPSTSPEKLLRGCRPR